MIAENIARISASLPSGTRLVAVSKLKPVDDIMEAYNAGQRLFGENYATELRDKAAVLPQDIQWHFIGHLQSKQLKYYIPFVSMIHGVDSLEHLEDVEKAAAKVGRLVDVLLQVHVAQEETKFGFLPEELENSQFSIFNLFVFAVSWVWRLTPTMRLVCVPTSEPSVPFLIASRPVPLPTIPSSRRSPWA